MSAAASHDASDKIDVDCATKKIIECSDTVKFATGRLFVGSPVKVLCTACSSVDQIVVHVNG